MLNRAGIRQLLTRLRISFGRWRETRKVSSQAIGEDVLGSGNAAVHVPLTELQPSTSLAQLGNTRERSRSLKRLITNLQPRRQKLSHQSDGSSGTSIESGDFAIDLPTRSVKVRGHELQLTTTEFEMLVFLTGHHKSVVTPDTMLATSWSGKEVRQAEFVRVLVSLRKKLDSVAGSTPSYIRTESWIFYTFNPTLAHRF